jgi:menaquinone-9 beta-reductase
LSETITITGGGLTGLSLAIGLRNRGVPVVLYEAGFYPRHRVCGEFISGVSRETLEVLGIAELFSDAGRHRSVAWFTGDRHTRDHVLTEPALAISRYVLDDRLQKLAVEVGVDSRMGSRRKMEPHKSGEVWTAGRKPVKGEWIGLKAHVRGMNTRARLEMHSGPGGYLGVTPVEDGWYNVCGLFRIDRGIEARQEELLGAYLFGNGNKELAKRIEMAEWREGSFSAVAGFALGLQKPTMGVLSLGDSYAIIPPFTGNGMSMAFQSAEIAMPHLRGFSDGSMTWLDACGLIQRELTRRFGKRLVSARMLHPLLFHSVAGSLLKYAPLKPILSLIR